jgi:hypothetical protein
LLRFTGWLLPVSAFFYYIVLCCLIQQENGMTEATPFPRNSILRFTAAAESERLCRQETKRI